MAKLSRVVGIVVGCFSLWGQSPSDSVVPIWTQRNDNARTGVNATEVLLTPATVKLNRFGKLFAYVMDDQTYSQPLYMPGLTMASDGKKHNVVFMTTVNNSVYAFDADTNQANGGLPLWKRSLTPPGARPPNAADMSRLGACHRQYHDFAGNMGIVGTPVIDIASNTIYLVARTIEGKRWVQRLHALDLSTGSNKLGAPVVIAAAYQGASFDPVLNNQRPALALVNGVVYIGWSSHCDFGAYHGWIIGYSASDLSKVAVWSPTAFAGGTLGGIWQSGQGVAADSSGNLYLSMGNGDWDGQNNFGMSTVKLAPGVNKNKNLLVKDFFTPSNYLENLNHDIDFGSAGPVLIPGTKLLIGADKQGKVFVMSQEHLGGMTEDGPDNILQEFQAIPIPPSGTQGPTNHNHGAPVYVDTGAHRYLYIWGENDFLRAFEFYGEGQRPIFSTTAVAASAVRSPQFFTGMPGGFLSASSNKNEDGIVWALTPYGCNANQAVEPGILYAFDASQFQGSGATRDLVELWDSRQNQSRDDVGYFAKFTNPTIANGKVYVASWGDVPVDNNKCSGPTAPSNRGQLAVYGILSPTLR